MSTRLILLLVLAVLVPASLGIAAAESVDTGRVHAVDIQQDMLTLLGDRMKDRGVMNVVGVLGTIQDPKLPAGQLELNCP